MIGDAQDVYNRLIAQLPNWFGLPGGHETLDQLLSAFIQTTVYNYNQCIYAQLQTRINNYDQAGHTVPPSMLPIIYGATGQQLDIISIDYLGSNLPREPNESDRSFRKRILVNLLRPKCTRNAMRDALLNMQNVIDVVIFEPENYFDVGGGYGSISTSPPYFMAYGVRGLYGSANYQYQCFIDVYVSAQGMANASGYGDFFGGYGDGFPLPSAPPPLINFYYGGLADITTPTTATMIYQTINLTKVFGTICWVNIHFI